MMSKVRGFVGADLEAAVRDVVKQAVVHGDESITDQTFISFFENVVPLSQTSPEQIDYIRTWGRERAVPAGKPFDDTSVDQEQYPRRKGPRSVLLTVLQASGHTQHILIVCLQNMPFLKTIPLCQK